ncbi:hypothetical protein HVY04_05840 [Citrobacter freundii]|uniref:hypothetical protein n=1 Tax=Citrobacter freundii TaxID=546 RepID=UPI0015E91B53|nr:hypothetical protein [Citrobacter freundii]QMJ02657.1 hypothetical protein HVY06_05840 [Citrobacter freundii]QMJ11727.1 hypothetical protein HVY04_05840 [Citrobacter freundii]
MSTGVGSVQDVVDRDYPVDCLIYSPGVCYGGVRFLGGVYHTNGSLIVSGGWGGGVAGTKEGLKTTGSCSFYDWSSLTDGYIQYNINSGGIQSYIYHDLSKATITSVGRRPIANYQITNESILKERLILPSPIPPLYGTTINAFSPRNCHAVISDVVGLSGPDTLINATTNDGAYIRKDALITVNGNIMITSTSSSILNGMISGVSQGITIKDDKRSLLAVGDVINIIGG